MVWTVQEHTSCLCQFNSVRCQRILQRVSYPGHFITFHDIFLFIRLTAVLLRNGPSNIIFFGCRDPLRSVLPGSLEKFGLLADFLSGACLGAFISTIFYPLNTTKTHMQVEISCFILTVNIIFIIIGNNFQKSLGGEFRSFSSVFVQLLRERGVGGMFRGVHVNYTRSFLSWGIINMTYGCLLRLLRDTR